ncbi:MAG: GNAT family N-acetyltransferase [Clostridia bacterium]
MLIETERLRLREMAQEDYSSVCLMLQDASVMYAYEHAFSDDESHIWLDKQIARYHNEGIGLLAVILKETGEFIGQCGLTFQDCDGKNVVEVGYIFNKKFWGHGYATEAAIACRKFAFETLNINEVYSIIRDNNYASQNVAKRNGMTKIGCFIKNYYNIDMPHYIYCVKKSECNK